MSGYSDSPYIYLTPGEVREVYDVANGYHAYGLNPNAIELGIRPIEACLLGAMGELAACKFYGVPYEPVFEPDGGFDLQVGDWTANVKATPYVADPWLRVMDKLNKNCDAYVLVAVSFTSAMACLVGWIRNEDLFAKPLKRLRKDLPPCRVATAADLEPCRRPQAVH